MAIPSSIIDSYNIRVQQIENSEWLSDEEKLSLRSKLRHTFEGTNGLTQKDKLQSVSESVYWLSEADGRQTERFNKLEASIKASFDDLKDNHIYNGKFSGLFRLLENAKWAITVCVIAICTLFTFHPQIALMLEKIIPGIN